MEWTFIPYGVDYSTDQSRISYSRMLQQFLWGTLHKALASGTPGPPHLQQVVSMLEKVPIGDTRPAVGLERLAGAPGTALLQILEEVLGNMAPQEILSKKAAESVRSHPLYSTIVEDDMYAQGFEQDAPLRHHHSV